MIMSMNCANLVKHSMLLIYLHFVSRFYFHIFTSLLCSMLYMSNLLITSSIHKSCNNASLISQSLLFSLSGESLGVATGSFCFCIGLSVLLPLLDSAIIKKKQRSRTITKKSNNNKEVL